jgi:hypothetical protein
VGIAPRASVASRMPLSSTKRPANASSGRHLEPPGGREPRGACRRCTRGLDVDPVLEAGRVPAGERRDIGGCRRAPGEQRRGRLEGAPDSPPQHGGARRSAAGMGRAPRARPARAPPLRPRATPPACTGAGTSRRPRLRSRPPGAAAARPDSDAGSRSQRCGRAWCRCRAAGRQPGCTRPLDERILRSTQDPDRHKPGQFHRHAQHHELAAAQYGGDAHEGHGPNVGVPAGVVPRACHDAGTPMLTRR